MESTLFCNGTVTTLQADLAQSAYAHEEQWQRQQKAEYRAREAAMSQQRRVKEMGRESALSYGQRLYKVTHGALTAHIDAELAAFVAAPDRARRFASAMPWLDNFKGAGHIAAVALTAAINQLSRKQKYATFCQNLGAAIEKETRLMQLERKSRLEMRHLIRQGMSRSQMASRGVMQQLGVFTLRWADRTRLDVGCFLADAVIQSTELFSVRLVKVGRSRQRMVFPSEQSLHFIQTARIPTWRAAQSAMVCQPMPWHDMWGGGILNNSEPLVLPPVQDAENPVKALEHFTKRDLAWLYGAVNYLQATPLRVDGDMVTVARTSWEGGFAGLWPCGRAPMEVPERLGSDPDPAELKARNRLAAIAHRDRTQNRPRRIKIERAIQQGEQLRDRTVWQAYHCDHRGRIYTGNRFCTHQGMDFEKAQLNFDKAKPVNQEGIDWILKAAAGHYGLDKKSWEARLEWGQDNIQLMRAAAQDPLERLELWRGAKDPFQFLQLCKGLVEALETGSCSAPIRFDQTTSGPGIIACLVRDKTVGRLCNIYGSTRRDLYTGVADAVRLRLQKDLDYGDTRERSLAEVWLTRGIDRALVKGPVMSVPYGGSYQSVADKLVAAMDEHLGFVPLEEFSYKVAIPSKYLASHVWAELKEAVAPVNSLKKWLKACCRLVMKQGHPLVWDTPIGWPMRIADREPITQRVGTLLYGHKISMNIADQPDDSPLSATQANKGLPANFIHSFDAALVHAVITRAVDLKMQLLCNHDCFCTHASDAGVLHRLLHQQFRELYRPDWLNAWRDELTANTGVSLPAPPMIGDLEVGLIGTNSYLFS